MMPAPGVLIDPMQIVTHYFVVPDDEDERHGLQKLLSNVAVEMAGLLRTTPPAVEVCESAADQQQQIALIPRRPYAGTEPALQGTQIGFEIATLHDAVMLRFSVLVEGQFAPDSLRQLDPPALKSLPLDARNYLGSLSAWCAEVAQTSDTTVECRALAQHAFGSRGRRSFELPAGTLAVIRPISPDLAHHLGAVFVYPQGTSGTIDPNPFLETLPELILCRLKAVEVHYQTGPLLKSSRAVASRLEQRLERPNGHAPVKHHLLQSSAAGGGTGAAATRATLEELKRLNDQVAADRAILAQHIGRVESLLQTLRINRHNLRRALRSPAFAAQAAPLAEYLFDSAARRIRQQSRADLGYHQITLHRAELLSEAFTAAADYREVIETQTLGYIMVFLTGVQAASVVPSIVPDFDKLHWIVRFLWIAGTTGGLSWAALWLLRRLTHRD